VLTTAIGATTVVGWVAIEVILRQPGVPSSLSGSSADRFSTPLLVVGYLVAAILPFVLSSGPGRTDGVLPWFGVAIGLVGLGVRAWGMRTLGNAYSRNLRTSDDQHLVTTGPYRYVRHPGYLGSVLVWVGAALAFGNWLVAGLTAVLLLAAYLWRIFSEEAMLRDHFGGEWCSYAARTARLLPGVW
jgi:protein-S-isoprenylcysteine O-methyltransferase